MNYKQRTRLIISIGLLFSASAVSVVVFSKIRKVSTPQHVHVLKAEQVTTLPAVFSRVKNLDVVGQTIVNQGQPQAAVAIDVVNNSDQPVISLEINAGDENNWSALGIDGLEDPNNPQVIIPPHSLKTFTWFLGEILEDHPIVISGARFADGTEYGDARSLEIMRQDLERHKERKRR